jgi:DNA-directed RNA polymerase subunit M/transcription elongation factor TFIIS
LEKRRGLSAIEKGGGDGMTTMEEIGQKLREQKAVLDAAIEETEFEILKSDIEFYFAKLVNKDLEKARQTMRRIRALVDQKLSILERQEVARKYKAECPRCGSGEVAWVEKLHDCDDCQVWAISCLECRCEWLDVIWKVR